MSDHNNTTPEAKVREIRWKTRRRYSAEEKIRIV
jgi:transposase-like protein